MGRSFSKLPSRHRRGPSLPSGCHGTNAPSRDLAISGCGGKRLGNAHDAATALHTTKCGLVR